MDRYSLIKEAPPAYAKQYDDEDSSHSEDSLLEKATDFQYKKPAFYKRLPTAVLIHLLLALANVSFCFLFLSWTIDQYSHGPRLRFCTRALHLPRKRLTKARSSTSTINRIIRNTPI
jgi:hypothetical protein